jgi:hypothetical protein
MPFYNALFYYFFNLLFLIGNLKALIYYSKLTRFPLNSRVLIKYKEKHGLQVRGKLF